MPPNEATLVETRLALQSLAEHVVCAARHAATGRIGLVSSPGGFATPGFPSSDGDRVIAVQGFELVVTDGRGERRAPLTTIAAAAELAEVVPGAPTDVFTPTTPLEPDAPLAIDAEAAAVLAAWWSLVSDALAVFVASHGDETSAGAQLWPEHFDIGAQVGECNYGGSPGDAGDPVPYLYVGPWAPSEPDGDYWNRPFGAAVAATEIPTVEAAVAFFEAGHRRLPR